MTPRESRLVAVLGPTNTGKTHLAIERMLAHRSGMIGFPLRLLARENYDRVVRLRGRGAVALITGEEKIVPRAPAYWVCTAEAMPLDRTVEFLAIDEVQLCADPERGHVFTDRVLRARGREETMFLGADTIKPLLRRLVPDLRFVGRPRFSRLDYTGPRKLTRLPPRSAIVAFSAADVYAIAELIRRKRGGTAVVLGALSPRTRNAQVALYQDGEVDYLVATDAIGMGLNMDVSHVGFSALVKFDGRAPRRLSPAELAQIAGRAGRYQTNGTFGTTGPLGPLDPELVEAIENHRFDPLEFLYWRNHRLDFRSLDRLIRSLEAPPPGPMLRRVRDSDDLLALKCLAQDPDIRALADGPEPVRQLWDICQIPDYRKIMTDAHSRLLGRLYRHMREEGAIPAEWIARQVAALDRADGDIEALAQRIAFVRTWTFVSHRADWLADARHWQERTRAIEDRLSDALHERLTQRFVDRRTATLVRRMRARDGRELIGAVDEAGEVLVEGEHVGRLDGFRFVPDGAAGEDDAKALTGAATRALRSEMPARIAKLIASADEAVDLSPDGRLAWDGAPVAVLVPGATPLVPRVRVLPSDLLEPAQRRALERHLTAWTKRHVARGLRGLEDLAAAPLAGPARGLAFQLVEGLGSVPRRQVASLVDGLDKPGRGALAGVGIRIGRESVYLPPLLKPKAVALRALLWSVHHDLGDLVAPPAPGRQSVPIDPAAPPGFFEAIGYRALGGHAVRLDRLEALAGTLARLARQRSCTPPLQLAKLAGFPASGLPEVLAVLGYRAIDGPEGVAYARARPPKRGTRRRGRAKPPTAARADSPFAKLKDLMARP